MFLHVDSEQAMMHFLCFFIAMEKSSSWQCTKKIHSQQPYLDSVSGTQAGHGPHTPQ